MQRESGEEWYLLLAKKGEMKQDLKGLGVCSQDDELGNTTIESLGG